jgi:hypothetical protein
MVEPLIVVQVVAGSNPVGHPSSRPARRIEIQGSRLNFFGTYRAMTQGAQWIQSYGELLWKFEGTMSHGERSLKSMLQRFGIEKDHPLTSFFKHSDRIDSGGA